MKLIKTFLGEFFSLFLELLCQCFGGKRSESVGTLLFLSAMVITNKPVRPKACFSLDNQVEHSI